MFQALTWVFQIMPLFFFAGVAAASTRGNPGTSWGNWLMRRSPGSTGRCSTTSHSGLSRWPCCGCFLPEHVYEPVAGISIQLLWFLGAYVLVLAAVPLLARITTTGRIVVAVAGTYVHRRRRRIRINVDGPPPLGYLNMVAWLIPGMLGVAYRRRLLAGRAALTLGGVMFTVNIALLVARPLRAQPGRHRDPTSEEHDAAVAAAGRSRNHDVRVRDCCCARDRAVGAAPAGVVAGRDRQLGAMTLYLWHIPPLLAMHLAFDYLGYPRYDPSAPGFIALSVLQLLIMAALVAAVFVALRPLENNPLPLWDGGFVVTPGRAARRSAPCCAWRVRPRWRRSAGVSRPRALLRGGDAGRAGRARRFLASDPHSPQRVCAASLPARTT